MFLIGVRVISGTVTAEQAGEAFAQLAEVLIRAMVRVVQERFVADHGRIAGQEIAILAMGKLGGREMTAGSDLDLILVYDFDDEHPISDGARPLTGSQYFARFTQRLINALTSPTNYGRLYAVDMRLRPSGRSGPLATSFASFSNYQNNEAWTWEHMALTRARVIVGLAGVHARIEATIGTYWAPARSGARRRRRGRYAPSDRGRAQRRRALELKDAAGGLVDVEFVAQYLQLAFAAARSGRARSARRARPREGRSPRRSSPRSTPKCCGRRRGSITISRRCFACASRGRSIRRRPAPKLLQLLARAGDVPDFATLEAHLIETQARVRKSFEGMIGGQSIS